MSVVICIKAMLLSSLLYGQVTLVNGKARKGWELRVHHVSRAYTRSKAGLGIGCKFVDSLSNNQVPDILIIDFVVHCAMKLGQGIEAYIEAVKELLCFFFKLISKNKAEQVIFCSNTVERSFYIICPGTD